MSANNKQFEHVRRLTEGRQETEPCRASANANDIVDFLRPCAVASSQSVGDLAARTESAYGGGLPQQCPASRHDQLVQPDGRNLQIISRKAGAEPGWFYNGLILVAEALSSYPGVAAGDVAELSPLLVARLWFVPR